MSREIVWVAVPLSAAEFDRICKKHPRELTVPGTRWASIRQALGLSDKPIGLKRLRNDNG